MNIFQELERTHSKENSLKIIAYIGDDKEKFSELMDCFFMETKDYRVPQRAAHVVSLSFDQNPEFIQPYIPKLIKHLFIPDLKGALKRNILRIFQFTEVPKKERGKVYDKVCEFLSDPKEEIAIRAFAMTVLYKITTHHPELKPELFTTIQFVLEKPNSSPAIRSRGKHVLSQLIQDGIGDKFLTP